ncbi:MAG: DUF1003 domain-containing protein [Actinomycetes bacterium]
MSKKIRSSRLDQPRRSGLQFKNPYDPERFGLLSERVARRIGSWRFIALMTIFIIAWILWNTIGPENYRVDPWPFLALTLMLSLQASYAAPLILLAQNRQADRDRVQIAQDRTQAARLLADSEFLARELADLRIALSDVATRDYIKNELRELIEEIQFSNEKKELE